MVLVTHDSTVDNNELNSLSWHALADSVPGGLGAVGCIATLVLTLLRLCTRFFVSCDALVKVPKFYRVADSSVIQDDK